MKRVLAIAVVVGVVAMTVAIAAQQSDADADLHVLHVQGNVYMLVGAGGNSALQVGNDGVLVVDTQLAPLADKVVAEIRRLSDKPIQYILNTSADEAHTGGNEALSKAGRYIAGGNVRAGATGASIMAHINVLNRMSAPTGQTSTRPEAAWPTDTFFTESLELFFNGESIQMLAEPAAHTDGDSIVYFRRSDVVSTGDIFNVDLYPFVDAPRGGTVKGLIDALNHVIDIAIPGPNEEDGTLIIPGHGRLCDEADIVEYRDMVSIIHARIADAVKKGRTLDQVKAAHLTTDYDGRYGATTGPWTTDMFVEAIYREVGKKPAVGPDKPETAPKKGRGGR